MGFIENVRAKIPRIRKGPCCWTIEEFALRTAMSEFSIFALVAGTLFYLSTTVEDTDTHDTTVGIFVSVGVVFCFPVVFAVLLCVGVLKKSVKLMKIWLIYAAVETIIYTLFFIILTIFAFTINIGSAFILLFFTLIIVVHFLHTIAVVHSICVNIEESGNTVEQP